MTTKKRLPALIKQADRQLGLFDRPAPTKPHRPDGSPPPESLPPIPRDSKDYHAVRKAVQVHVNAFARQYPKLALKGSGQMGIEKNKLFGTWTVFGLPNPQNRTGHELRCEVVVPDFIPKV